MSARSLRISGYRVKGLVKPKLPRPSRIIPPFFVADALAASRWRWSHSLRIAIAIVSGAEPAAGLVTAIVGGF